MKRITSFFSILLLALHLLADNKVELTPAKTNGQASQNLIPVNVNWQNRSSLLEVQFTGPVQAVFVVVTGPDGVVYQNQITTENAKSIYVDLKPYREGEYTIRFQDAYGNEVEGDFFKEFEDE